MSADGIRQFVTFRMAGQLYGLDVREVREVQRRIGWTPAPLAPAYVRGVMNLRGQVVTVMDLARRLELRDAIDPSEAHCLILQAAPVGLLVRQAGDVVAVAEDRLEPPPPHRRGRVGEFVEAVAEQDDGVLTVLSVSRIVRRDKGDDERGGAAGSNEERTTAEKPR